MPQQISKSFTQYSVGEYLNSQKATSYLIDKLIKETKYVFLKFKLNRCKKHNEYLSELLDINYVPEFELSKNGVDVFLPNRTGEVFTYESLLKILKNDEFKTRYAKLCDDKIEDVIALFEFLSADKNRKKSKIYFSFGANEISFETTMNTIDSDVLNEIYRINGDDFSKLDDSFDATQSLINLSLVSLAYINVVSVLNEIAEDYNKLVKSEITTETLIQSCEDFNINVLEDDGHVYISYNNLIIFLDFLNTKQ